MNRVLSRAIPCAEPAANPRSATGGLAFTIENGPLSTIGPTGLRNGLITAMRAEGAKNIAAALRQNALKVPHLLARLGIVKK